MAIDPSLAETDIFDEFLKYGLFLGAIFQLVCIGAVIFVPSRDDKRVGIWREEEQCEYILFFIIVIIYAFIYLLLIFKRRVFFRFICEGWSSNILFLIIIGRVFFFRVIILIGIWVQVLPLF